MERYIGIKEIHAFELDILREIKSLCESNHIPFFLHAGTLLGAVRHKGFIPWDEDGDIAIPISYAEKFKDVFASQINKKYLLKTWSDKDHREYYMRVVLNGQEQLCAYIDVFFLLGAPTNPKLRKKMFSKQSRIVFWRHLKFINTNVGNVFVRLMRRIVKFLSKIIPLSIINKRYFKFATKYDYSTSDSILCSYGKYKMKYFFSHDVFEGTQLLPFEDLQLPAPNKYETELKQLYGDYMKYPKQEIIDAGMAHTVLFKE